MAHRAGDVKRETENVRSEIKALVLALALAGLAAAQGTKGAAAKPAGTAFDKVKFEAYVRHLFVWGPHVAVNVGDPKPSELPGFREVVVTGAAGPASFNQSFFVSADGRKIVQGRVFDIQENPFREELAKLRTGMGPSLGTPGAPVVLVLFTDYQCPYCRQEAQMLRQNLVSTYPKEVRLYLKDFPLEPIHPWAKPAAIAGRCIYGQNEPAFWQYHDWIFDQQQTFTPENLNSKVMEWAQGKEIDTLQLGRCIDAKATEADVDNSITDGRSLQLNATPTLFVNGRRLANANWEQLKAIIDFELAYQKTAKNAGDNACCEVKLPSPLQ